MKSRFKFSKRLSNIIDKMKELDRQLLLTEIEENIESYSDHSYQSGYDDGKEGMDKDYENYKRINFS